jgi:hypothetical protein
MQRSDIHDASCHVRRRDRTDRELVRVEAAQGRSKATQVGVEQAVGLQRYHLTQVPYSHQILEHKKTLRSKVPYAATCLAVQGRALLEGGMMAALSTYSLCREQLHSSRCRPLGESRVRQASLADH